MKNPPEPRRVIVFALPFEAAGFRPPRGWEMWVLGCAGAAAGKRFRQRCLESPPTFCVAAGLAGGLQPGLRVGEILLDAGGDSPETKWKMGRVLTSDALIQSAARKNALWDATRADICDLETAHLRAVAHEAGFPLWSLRSVSDCAATDLPVPAHILCRAKDGTTDLPGLVLWFLTHPAQWNAFFKMVGNAHAAKRSLHAALQSLLEELSG